MKKICSDILLKLSVIIIIGIYGCCPPPADLWKYESAEILAKKRFGTDYIVAKNESDTFILYFKNDERKNHPHKLVEYFVYDLKRKEIIFEEKLFDADIEWIDDQNIEIRINPEVISDDEANVFILNVLTKQKSKSNF